MNFTKGSLVVASKARFVYASTNAPRLAVVAKKFYSKEVDTAENPSERPIATEGLSQSELQQELKKAREKCKVALLHVKNLKRDIAQSRKTFAQCKKLMSEIRKKLSRTKDKAQKRVRAPKLCSSAAMLYASSMSKGKTRESGKSPLEEISRFRTEFKSLSVEKRAPYEAQAVANRKARLLLRRELKGLRMTPYALFVQDQYRSVSSTLPGPDGPSKMSCVGKALSQRWTTMGTQEKEVYQERARLIRSAAANKLNDN